MDCRFSGCRQSLSELRAHLILELFERSAVCVVLCVVVRCSLTSKQPTCSRGETPLSWRNICAVNRVSVEYESGRAAQRRSSSTARVAAAIDAVAAPSIHPPLPFHLLNSTLSNSSTVPRSSLLTSTSTIRNREITRSRVALIASCAPSACRPSLVHHLQSLSRSPRPFHGRPR